ncbi:SusD/RagB family nutrient-binding outer membrane lipoprotein [Hymenobacter convexus]|uniref:SusD/RagB family nutrient-binding outer membrane lipoprotein n=1 Tax=Hymenobacter sp. CA1UV-4 TaxID=3063782 RepID=UPI00271421B4|nr:SusD/RagB family nutrient-binding outer membrane lipoprotein [Hymenobacter sp. CA1UV-4]MDO7852778.1 SusD/RagB family nutrient-binding outer membrane lipoprotein [Hymenobacter sp. CA1UV-4]
MKNTAKILAVSSLSVLAASCDSFLDINQNPNNPLTVTADAVLAQALTTTANTYSINYNPYSAFAAGYIAKSGTVNGYAPERTYNYNSTFSQTLFNNTFDNIYDYDIIERQGKAANQPYHSAIAKIMKVYNYQLLVDEYGDIPYTKALGGLANITPVYDKADAIYKDFIVKLNEAIAEIDAANKQTSPIPRTVGAEDVVFQGTMANWVRFANSLKLRILMRQSSQPSLDAYVRTEMTRLQASIAAGTPGAAGFIASDVVVNPGYTQASGQQNPFWDRYRADAGGTSATERLYTIPTKYLLAQFLLNRDPRGYRIFNTTATGYAGGAELGESAPIAGNVATRFRDFGGVFKGPDSPVPLMLRAEDLFSQAEARERGFFTGGSAKNDFNAGITASFNYFYTPSPANRQNATRDSSAFVAAKVTKYLTAPVNVNNGLVNWDVTTTQIPDANILGGPLLRATTYAVRLTTPRPVTNQEKIIYQKYLAMTGVASTEAWDDYRRTGYPRFAPSLQTTSTRPDKLPTRLLYPQTEITTNVGNLPQGISQFTTLIFWDPN